ncbi:MAG: DUF190 domain-containing protein [Fervidobacterium sp.]|jgi:PII-like signaling protein
MEVFYGTYIRIFVKENAKCEAHNNKPLNRVISSIAIEEGITDFIEYKAMEGYIFDKKLHTTLREITDAQMPIIIELFAAEETAQRFLERIKPFMKQAVIIIFQDVRGMLFR